ADSRDQFRAVGCEGEAENTSILCADPSDHLAGAKVINANEPVVAAGGDLLTVRRDRCVSGGSTGMKASNLCAVADIPDADAVGIVGQNVAVVRGKTGEEVVTVGGLVERKRPHPS